MPGPTLREMANDASTLALVVRHARLLLGRYAALYEAIAPRTATGAEAYSPGLLRWLDDGQPPQVSLDRARSYDGQLAASRADLVTPDNGERRALLFGAVAETDLERDLLALLIGFDLSPQVAGAVRVLSLWPESGGVERSFLQSLLDPYQDAALHGEIAQLLRAGHRLSRRGVLRGLRETTASRAVFLDLSPTVLSWLIDGIAAAAARTPAVTWYAPDDPELARLAELMLIPEPALDRLVERQAAGGALRLRSSRGLDVLLATRLAARRGDRGVVVADLSAAVPEQGERPARHVIEDGALLASLAGGWLLLTGLEREGEPVQLDAEALSAAVHAGAAATLIEDGAPSDTPGVGGRLARLLDAAVFDVPFPDRDQREHIWTQALAPTPSLAGVSATLAGFPLGADQILEVSRRRDQGMDALEDGCRQAIGHRVGHLARRVVTRVTWDEIVLPESITGVVEEMLTYARHRDRVFREWGFGSKHASGIGLSALFSGPPGTGKTMLSGLVAKELGLDLYKIDLSRVVSKYIGETEERLARLFEEAERGGVALLFDEADSLFAKRTSVKSSVDRYANLEVNFLLQKMEDFDGVAVLTTNLDSSLDEAFRRRIRFHVKFALPNVEERERLWHAMMPAAAPLGADADLGAVAEAYEFSGGEIKNTSLRAAFFAVAEQSPITLEILDRAARAECAERGRLVRRSAFDFV